MKSTNFFGLVLVIALFGFASCLTKPVPYSFMYDESETASLIFDHGNPDVNLIVFEGIEMPQPEKKTHWEPILVPAGKPLNLTVHAYYYQPSGYYSRSLLVNVMVDIATTISRNVSTEVEFVCPPLETGKEYKLTFCKGGGLPGRNTLVLTDVETKKIVFEQEF